jgi:hypothetical protein
VGKMRIATRMQSRSLRGGGHGSLFCGIQGLTHLGRMGFKRFAFRVVG